MPKLIKLLQEAASRDLFQFLKLQNKLSQNSMHKTATFYALRFHELGIQQDIIGRDYLCSRMSEVCCNLKAGGRNCITKVQPNTLAGVVA